MRKNRGHYCIICGKYKANEKFSGSGHKRHICRQCAKLPIEKRNEILTVKRIFDLPAKLSQKQKNWLNQMREDPNDEIRQAADFVYEMHLSGKSLDEYSEMDDFDQEFIDSISPDDLPF